jgi:hypothetical protein
MKPIAVAACVLFLASLTQAQTTPAAKPTDPKAPDAQNATKATTTTKTPPAPGKAAPAKKDDKKKDEKKPEELPKIPGTTITRPDGNLLGLEVAGGVFKLTFYDKKHKVVPVDVTRATARWPNPRAPGDNRTVLNSNGTALVGQKAVNPPYNFNVFLTLLQGEGDEAKSVETYTVPFKG